MWNYLEWGGAQVYFLAIMKEARKDWDVKVVLPRKSGDGILRFLNEIEVEYQFIDTRIDVSQAFTIFDKLKRQSRRISSELMTYRHLLKYDPKETIVHLETAPWQSWILISALARRFHLFVTMHNALPFISKWKKILWSKRLNFILKLKKFHLFTANQNAKDSIKNLVTPENWKKITLTRAGINPAEIAKVLEKHLDRLKLLKKHKIPEDKFLILCVGQFIDRKGRWIYLEAAKKIIAIDSGYHFIWLTPIPPSDDDWQKINEFGLGEQFQIVLSENAGDNRFDILSFFRLADIFVLPSLFEGLPIAVLEAMALGIPTVSTNITALPEAVKPFETGILIEPGDSNALASAVMNLRNDSELRNKLSNDGSKYVCENFDERKTAQIVIGEYEKAINDLTEASKN